MNIFEIINEEFGGLLNEVMPRNVHAYPFTKESSSKYVVRIDDDDKNIHTNYNVYLSITGNEDERTMGIDFKEQQGGFGDINGFGVQFRILATVAKIVNVAVQERKPDIISFSPTKQGIKRNPKTGKVKNVNPNQRLQLYMNYVKEGAGEEYDSFIIGNSDKVSLELKNPSFPIENGYQDQETIQEVVTELSNYGGYYESGDVPTNHPNYLKFDMQLGRMMMSKGGERVKTTRSARRFVDWLMDYPELNYVAGYNDPNKADYVDPRGQQQSQQAVDSPVRPVGAPSGGGTGQAMIGTFDYFLQNNVHGIDRYAVLNDWFETAKSMNDFRELKQRSEDIISRGTTPDNQQRLQEVITAVDMLEREYEEYAREYGTEMSEVLNEVEAVLIDLLK